MKPLFTAASPAVIVQECLTLDYFHQNDDGVIPIPVTFNEGQGKIILAVEDNASGKQAPARAHYWGHEEERCKVLTPCFLRQPRPSRVISSYP